LTAGCFVDSYYLRKESSSLTIVSLLEQQAAFNTSVLICGCSYG
jgi:hypothetical protein